MQIATQKGSKYQFGMIGLGTMGLNLTLNIADHGFSIAGYDRDPVQVAALNNEKEDRKLEAFGMLTSFVASLAMPRNIVLLVPAGKIVDLVLAELFPLLTKGDLVMDCGNSHFADTARRITSCAEHNIHFVGAGISGGEAGARFGPSIMPGGDVTFYERLGPMLEAIAAKANGKACVAYMGNGAAGHYVKMVHNGIEYALMQIIAECYHIMKQYLGFSNQEMSDTFQSWNQRKLKSFLIEITAAVLTQRDDISKEDLIDKILDTAQQKGTGAWMSEDAMKIAAPIPAIDAAVSQRLISAMKAERVAAAQTIPSQILTDETKKKEFVLLLEDAVFASFIITFAQGSAMLQKASAAYGFDTKISEVTSIWRAGCIIRAEFLDEITNAFEENPRLQNLLLHRKFADAFETHSKALQAALTAAISQRIPVPVMYACHSYNESYHSAWLPANLIQAQRDFFGAHTYQRVDQPGIFHSNWQDISN